MKAERCVVYRRQSLDSLNDELGIDRQLKVCKAVAQSRGLSVTQVITDNSVSASKKGRPGYAELVSLMKSGQVDVVIILRIDRLLRLNDELEELIQLVEAYPVRVVTAEGEIDLATPQGRLMARILVSVARNEMEVKSARHKLANQQKAAQGLHHASWRAFGYEPDGLTVRESEAVVLHEMARRLIVGHSYRELCEWLNRQGITTARGGKWYPRGVRQMLELKRSAGIRDYEGVDYPAVWPAIFDPETWERLQLTIKVRGNAYTGSPVARRYLLTGLVFCGICGAGLNGTTKRDRPGRPLRETYYCRPPDERAKGGCGGVQRGAPALEHFVTESLLLRLDTPRLGALIEETKNDGQLRHLLEARNGVQLRLNEIIDDYGSGDLTKPQMVRAKAAAQRELDRLNKQLGGASTSLHRISLPAGKSVREAWDTAESDSWRRGVMGLLIKQVLVNPTDAKPVYWVGDKWYRFSPEAIDIVWKA